MQNVHFIVDLQFGSTGKGLLAGYLAETIQPDTIITAWGPNAGHTYVDRRGNKMVNIALPNGIVSPKLTTVLLGPGSVINPDLFIEEIDRYESLLQGVCVAIHPAAAVVYNRHRDAEAQYGFKIGSTMKGVGEAAIEKLRRQEPGNLAWECATLKPWVVPVETYNALVDAGKTVIIEGAQGFSLGINSGFYPHTTSRECTVQQATVDCGLPFDMLADAEVHGVCRTFPIRVANRFKDGVQIGYSGPCYDDQREIQWSDIGREPELTTVTKLPRRIFTFSKRQIREAVRMNGCTDVFLNFMNYLPDLGEQTDIIEAIEQTGACVRWLGNGPSFNDIVER